MGKTSLRVNRDFDFGKTKQEIINENDRKTVLKYKRKSFGETINDDESFDLFLPPDTKDEIDQEILSKYLTN